LTKDKQRVLQQLFRLNRRVTKAYVLKQGLEGLWKQSDEVAAADHLTSWVR